MADLEVTTGVHQGSPSFVECEESSTDVDRSRAALVWTVLLHHGGHHSKEPEEDNLLRDPESTIPLAKDARYSAGQLRTENACSAGGECNPRDNRQHNKLHKREKDEMPDLTDSMGPRPDLVEAHDAPEL